MKPSVACILTGETGDFSAAASSEDFQFSGYNHLFLSTALY